METLKELVNQRNKPEMVGMNVIIGQPLDLAVKLSEEYHKLGIKIVWGGAIPRIMPYVVPKYVNIDTNYYNEEPSFELIDYNNYEAAIYTSIGCPYTCSFCYHLKDKKVHFDPAEKVLEWMHYLHETYNIKSFKIMDDNFFTHKPRVKTILNMMAKNGYKIKQAHSNLNSLSDDVLKMCDGIVGKVGISIEHGDDKIRNELVNKNINIDRAYEAIALLKTMNISTIHNFIFGLPEWRLDYENFKVMKKIKEINPLARGVGFGYVSMPETPLTTQVEETYGKFPRTLEYWRNFDMSKINPKYSPWLDKDIANTLNKMIVLFNEQFGVGH